MNKFAVGIQNLEISDDWKDRDLFVRIKLVKSHSKSFFEGKTEVARGKTDIVWKHQFDLTSMSNIADPQFFVSLTTRSSFALILTLCEKLSWIKDSNIATVTIPINEITMDTVQEEKTIHRYNFYNKQYVFPIFLEVHFLSALKVEVLRRVQSERLQLSQHFNSILLQLERLDETLCTSTLSVTDNWSSVKKFLSVVTTQRITDIHIESSEPSTTDKTKFLSSHTVEQTLQDNGLYWGVDTVGNEIQVLYSFDKVVWLREVAFQFAKLQDGRTGRARKVTISLGRDDRASVSTYQFVTMDTDQLQLFPLLSAIPATYVKVQFSEPVVVNKNYGTNSYSYAVERVVFHGIAYDKAVDLFEKIPYKHFLTKEYSTKVHLSVIQCLFKYHLFVKLNEEQWEVLVDFLHHSNSVKLGPKTKQSFITFLSNLLNSSPHQQCFEAVNGLEKILQYASQPENLLDVSSIVINKFIRIPLLHDLKPSVGEFLVIWLKRLSRCSSTDLQHKSLQLQQELQGFLPVKHNEIFDSTLLGLLSDKERVVQEAINTFLQQIQLEEAADYFLRRSIIKIFSKRADLTTKCVAELVLACYPLLLNELVEYMLNEEQFLEIDLTGVGKYLKQKSNHVYTELLSCLKRNIHESDINACYAFSMLLCDRETVNSEFFTLFHRNNYNVPSLKLLCANTIAEVHHFWPTGYLQATLPSELYNIIFAKSFGLSLTCTILLMNEATSIALKSNKNCVEFLVRRALKWLTFDHLPVKTNAEDILSTVFIPNFKSQEFYGELMEQNSPHFISAANSLTTSLREMVSVHAQNEFLLKNKLREKDIELEEMKKENEKLRKEMDSLKKNNKL